MIKILVFIDWYKPAYKAGGPISSVSNMVGLLNKEIDFYIVTGSKDLNSSSNLEGVVLNKWQKKDSVNVIYLDEGNQKIKTLKYILNEINPDKIYINGIFSKFFSLLPCLLFSKKLPTIINPRGMFGSGAMMIKRNRKSIFVKLINLFSFYSNILWHLSNEDELGELKAILKSDFKFVVAPNISKEIPFKIKEKSPEGLKLISICRVNKIKNLEFLIDLMFKIDFKCSLKIVGFIEDEIYHKSLINKLKTLPKNVQIIFTGELSGLKIIDLINNADLFISTSLNENYGHSIVESLSTGTPILISEHCPWNNLDEFNAGFKLPLEPNLFIDKLKQFNNMEAGNFEKYNFGAREYYDNHISSDLFKDTYIKMLTTKK